MKTRQLIHESEAVELVLVLEHANNIIAGVSDNTKQLVNNLIACVKNGDTFVLDVIREEEDEE